MDFCVAFSNDVVLMNWCASLESSLSICWLSNKVQPQIAIVILVRKVYASIIRTVVMIIPHSDDVRVRHQFLVTRRFFGLFKAS